MTPFMMLGELSVPSLTFHLCMVCVDEALQQTLPIFAGAGEQLLPS